MRRPPRTSTPTTSASCRRWPTSWRARWRATAPSSSCATSRCTTASPACRTARCSSTGSATRSAARSAPRRSSPSCSSTSTTSRRSTTRSGTPPATSCCACWPAAGERPPGGRHPRALRRDEFVVLCEASATRATRCCSPSALLDVFATPFVLGSDASTRPSTICRRASGRRRGGRRARGRPRLAHPRRGHRDVPGEAQPRPRRGLRPAHARAGARAGPAPRASSAGRWIARSCSCTSSRSSASGTARSSGSRRWCAGTTRARRRVAGRVHPAGRGVRPRPPRRGVGARPHARPARRLDAGDEPALRGMQGGDQPLGAPARRAGPARGDRAGAAPARHRARPPRLRDHRDGAHRRPRAGRRQRGGPARGRGERVARRLLQRLLRARAPQALPACRRSSSTARFVADVATNPADLAIVRGRVEIAGAMGLATSPRASRPTSSSSACARSAATTPRATCSRRRCRRGPRRARARRAGACPPEYGRTTDAPGRVPGVRSGLSHTSRLRAVLALAGALAALPAAPAGAVVFGAPSLDVAPNVAISCAFYPMFGSLVPMGPETAPG